MQLKMDEDETVECELCGGVDYEDEMEVHHGCYVCTDCSFDEDEIATLDPDNEE